MQKTLISLLVFSYVGLIQAAQPLQTPNRIPNNIAELNRIDAQHQQRREQQAQAKNAQLIHPEEVSFDVSQEKPAGLPADESPCYPVREVHLIDYQPVYSDTEPTPASRFYWVLRQAERDLNLTLPHCFGAEGIGILMKQVQNRIISHGYITTRVVINEQDLNRGRLILTVIPGKVRNMIVEDRSAVPRFTRLNAWTATAFKRGDLLNVRDIEQTLENLKRLPTVDANIEIIPGEGEDAGIGDSDLKITYAQSFPFRLNIGLDDSGSKSTGKWQGSATLSIDNMLFANDLFYAGFTHSIKRHTDDDGARSTRNLSFYYSVPFGYWALTAYHSRNRYHQEIFSSFNNSYIYSGETETDKLTLSYLLYRDAFRKTTVSGGFWSRISKNYVDGSEIEVQRRRMAGWEAGISHKEYIGASTLELRADYKRGTGARGALSAPEEVRSEGTSRPQIITAAISLTQPFMIGRQPWQFHSSWNAQWNQTPLILQDRFALGGRYTVRGFDGELSLYGERGWLWRNELDWNVNAKGHSLYLALDGGLVRGQSSPASATGRGHLIGSALGIRGGWNGFYYDFFIGTPLSKPDGFKTSHGVTGFNVGYSF